jgi:hypothetical protein
MKILNFAKNLAKSALRGLAVVFSALLGTVLLMGGCFICIYIIGYASSLFGLLIPAKDGDDYIVTGYVVFVILALLCIISIAIHGMCVKIKEIWQDS